MHLAFFTAFSIRESSVILKIMNTIVSIEHLEKVYTARRIFDDTACYIGEGEKLALIGVNGTGKSTLLRILAGEESPDGGELIVRKGIVIRFLSQNPQFLTAETALSACLRMAGGEVSGEDTTAAAKKTARCARCRRRGGDLRHDVGRREKARGTRGRAPSSGGPSDSRRADQPLRR